MVLSQLAWTSGSPLFDALDAAGSVPSYKDVALPSVAGVGRSVASPLIHPRVRKLGAKVLESPLSALHDRHTSPGSNARRALFTPGGTIRSSPIPIAPKPPPQAKGGVTVQVFTDSLKKKLQQGPPRPRIKTPRLLGNPQLVLPWSKWRSGAVWRRVHMAGPVSSPLSLLAPTSTRHHRPHPLPSPPTSPWVWPNTPTCQLPQPFSPQAKLRPLSPAAYAQSSPPLPPSPPSPSVRPRP